MATTPIEQPAEPKAGTVEQVTRPVLGVLRGAWYMSLGLIWVAGEQAGRAVKALVEKGKQVAPTVTEQGKKASEGVSEVVGDVGGRLKVLASKVGRAPEVAEAALDERIGAALQRTGFPSKAEIEALSSKVDSLAERLENTQRAQRPSRKFAESE
jgi:poly(hydroxyalkanoate) granule-associated protein